MKQAKYNELVNDVSKCDLCDNYDKTDKNGNKVILQHYPDRKHINLWSYWQGSLDAKILVIGQDWGTTTGKEFKQVISNINYSQPYISNNPNPTNNTLCKLFYQGLGIDITVPNNDV